MSHCTILIPAYNPDEKLLKLLRDLKPFDFSHIIVVNDGSRADTEPIFAEVEREPNVILLRHAVNLGKGAALKTALDYIYCNLKDSIGVVTADSDGQHSPNDIARLVDALVKSPDHLILGARKFDKDVPLRSMFGNKLTAILMRLLLGVRITDSQTGLRAIPRDFIPDLLRIPYNRYEFELEMILLAKRKHKPISELTIETIYLENNASSHFNPIFDSFKIYIVLFRYILVSLLTALVDFCVFAPTVALTGNEVLAVGLGRAAGAAVQYTLVRNLVFYSREKVLKTLPMYLALVICSGIAAYVLMNAIETNKHVNVYVAKIIAEVIIYIANFLIQRDFIFKRGSVVPESDGNNV